MEIKQLIGEMQGLDLEELKKMLAENEKEHDTLKMLIAVKEGKTLARKPRTRKPKPESGG